MDIVFGKAWCADVFFPESLALVVGMPCRRAAVICPPRSGLSGHSCVHFSIDSIPVSAFRAVNTSGFGPAWIEGPKALNRP